MAREGKENGEIRRKPIGLAEGGKNPRLNILDPEVFVDAKMLGDGVGGDEEAGKERDGNNLATKTGGNVDGKDEGKSGIRKKRK